MSAKVLCRPHEWLNVDGMKPLYGVQVRKNGVWAHACIGSKPLLYATKRGRNDALKRLRASLSSSSPHKDPMPRSEGTKGTK